jgi:Na+-driven multidrug efflux pump
MGTLFGFVLALSLVLSGIILLLHQPILTLVNIPDEARDMAVEYMIICTIGLFFTAGYNMVSAVLRGMGDAKRPFMFIAIASVTNLLLDLLFTGWLGWGVAGAAWATIIGQGVSFVFSLFYLYRKREAFGFDFA